MRATAAAWSRLQRFVHETLIVPAAHTRVLDSQLQGELYEVFHTRGLARWGHGVCTPITNTALLALAGELTIDLAAGGGRTSIAGGVAVGVVVLAFYVAVHGAWAFVMAPLLALALGAAELLRHAAGDHLVPIAIAIAITSTLLQTFSHAFEPVPPPWVPGPGFGTTRDVVTRGGPSKVITLAIASVVIYPVLELWATPRIWPLQIAHVLGRWGLLPGRAAQMDARVAAIHEDARVGWEMPRDGAT